jgi:hypothetical protein
MCPTTKYLGLHGRSYPLLVGEAKPLSFELILEHTVLFDEMLDYFRQQLFLLTL